MAGPPSAIAISAYSGTHFHCTVRWAKSFRTCDRAYPTNSCSDRRCLQTDQTPSVCHNEITEPLTTTIPLDVPKSMLTDFYRSLKDDNKLNKSPAREEISQTMKHCHNIPTTKTNLPNSFSTNFPFCKDMIFGLAKLCRTN